VTGLLLNGAEFGGISGPEIGGKRTLILASDNNFSATQFTQFVAFTVE
jgi:hypothetical protein